MKASIKNDDNTHHNTTQNLKQEDNINNDLSSQDSKTTSHFNSIKTKEESTKQPSLFDNLNQEHKHKENL